MDEWEAGPRCEEGQALPLEGELLPGGRSLRSGLPGCAGQVPGR